MARYPYSLRGLGMLPPRDPRLGGLPPMLAPDAGPMARTPLWASDRGAFAWPTPMSAPDMGPMARMPIAATDRGPLAWPGATAAPEAGPLARTPISAPDRGPYAWPGQTMPPDTEPAARVARKTPMMQALPFLTQNRQWSQFSEPERQQFLHYFGNNILD